ncbi:MAG: [acyl-carrier-protein] S-malonyltransferase [Flammeovirgaceae bacterium]|nr:[acyl-carrier-protein] S-malonyltransferase [Flammeovirgaceae bacterium]|tara:strand:+ start:5978 stop:6850 length:873 start_codon:yes stop_codon:yes gene_type:complete
MHAFVFPGQGAQYPGMGKELFATNSTAKKYFLQANEILGFEITQIMFEGTVEDLKQTRVTQPAVFLHSIINALCKDNFSPEMLAGHSLGEFSALVASGVLDFEDGLRLVSQRSLAMQKACEKEPSTMAAIIGLTDEQVEEICFETEGIVVAANYNCPGQLVISGQVAAVNLACEGMKAAGAKRALLLPVSGAFHSPLMESARSELAEAIAVTEFRLPKCPIYQNVDAKGNTDVSVIKSNLIAQLTSPVKWTQCVKQMISDGATSFHESGPGNVLQGLVKKVNREMQVNSF